MVDNTRTSDTRTSDTRGDDTRGGGTGTSGTGTSDTGTEELRAAERRLQAAQLASDVEELDRLIDERLVFTGPDGSLYSKQDDLHVHRSGQQTMSKVVEEDLAVVVVGRTGVTWFLGTLEGTAAGTPFAARVRYTRTWVHDDDHGWRLVAAHVSQL